MPHRIDLDLCLSVGWSTVVPIIEPCFQHGLEAVGRAGEEACGGIAEADIVVVGAGVAGLAAAWEAAEGGGQVVVLDMWSVFGGHAVMSEGGVSMVDTPTQHARGILDSPDLAIRDFIEWGKDNDRAWVERYARTSKVEIHDWLFGLAVRSPRS